MGSILRERGDALRGAAGLGVSVRAEAAEVGQVVEGWLEPGSRAGKGAVVSGSSTLAVQEISVAIAPYVPAFSCPGSPRDWSCRDRSGLAPATVS